mmetsp:Transcript_9752/g.14251  ORF Transcript_9752/g.14251 Transcript_9752/m.14251 type:complete len:118 (+) Transcript_9752:958-1311(+)
MSERHHIGEEPEDETEHVDEVRLYFRPLEVLQLDAVVLIHDKNHNTAEVQLERRHEGSHREAGDGQLVDDEHRARAERVEQDCESDLSRAAGDLYSAAGGLINDPWNDTIGRRPGLI